MKSTCWRALTLLAVGLILMATSSCVPISSAQNNSVSIVQLIATPEKYDGEVVQVEGFLRLEFEGNVIYLHEDDYKHGISKNGLWIERNAKIDEKAEQLNMHYVVIEGTFHATNQGHLGLNAGAISDITFATICPTRKAAGPELTIWNWLPGAR